LLGGAAALLHLITFEEPFGLSVVEALATGTPVIATPLGSLPELVHHGATGFLVDSTDEAVDAVAHLSDLDRGNCRREAEMRFSAQRMVDDYESLFRRVAGS
jgi:glycosyltransferase involved in cell wall biosynthesis